VGIVPPMRNYVVAAWERRRHRERELHQVTAETAEHAIVAIASSRPLDQQPGVYEAWPTEAPELNLRITYAAPRRRARFLSETE
jgi:hypothetical protein